MTFYPAMIICFYLFGIGPGIFAAILSASVAHFIFIRPYWTFFAISSGDIAVVNFLFSAALIGFVVSRLQKYSRQALRSVVDVRIAATAFESQESLMVTDANSVILRVNHAFTEVTGYTAEEVVGQTPQLFKSGRHDAEFYRTMWETLLRTGVWQGEIWDRRKNGEVYPKWLSITAVKDDQGMVTHYVGSHIDITERKQALQQLLDHQQELERVVLASERLNECKSEQEIYQRLCDETMGIFNLRLSWIGRVEQGNFDIRPVISEGPERGYLEKITVRWDDSAYGNGPAGRAVKTGQPQIENDIEGDNSYGTWRDEALRHGFRSAIGVPLVCARNKTVALMSLYSDQKNFFNKDRSALLMALGMHAATDIQNLRLVEGLEERVKVRTEELTLAKQHAEAANRAKSEFLSSMSHELRTPLNAILGFAQLLDMDPQIRTPEQRESISHIMAAGQQLLELINDLLDFARIDIGKLTLNLQPLRMAEIASRCVTQVAVAMAQQKNVVIENTLTDPVLLVHGDDQRVRQVLINLLTNAVKYNTEHGRVTVSSEIRDGDRLRIIVRDTGIGIAPGKLPLLFTPFERMDQRHGTISGIGIGLSITKQLVEAMGGSVGVESEPGKGSLFWFELPLAQEVRQVTVDSNKTGLPLPGRDARFVVLYVEDNPVNRKLVQTALKNRLGVELLSATTAEEGLTIAEESQPDLILMDILLPGIDGITATTILKDTEATRGIPVVALSADAQKNDIDRALNAGCSDYLTKPIQLQALYELIDKMRLAKNI